MPKLTPAQLIALLVELDAKTREIDAAPGVSSGPLWGMVHKLLLKSPIDKVQAMRIIGSRDIDLLRKAIADMRGDGSISQGGAENAAAPAGVPSTDDEQSAKTQHATIGPEVLKEAMKAFRRRLKLVRLDHESKLSARALTGGRKADFQAILPPLEFRSEVWLQLAAEGKLLDAGGGFYMLPDEHT